MNHQRRPLQWERNTRDFLHWFIWNKTIYFEQNSSSHQMSKQEFYEACELPIFAKSCLSKTKLIIKISLPVKTMWYHKLNKNLQCDIIYIVISMMNTYYAICLKYWRPHKYTKTTSFPIFYEFNLYYLKQNGHCYGLNVQDNVP